MKKLKKYLSYALLTGFLLSPLACSNPMKDLKSEIRKKVEQKLEQRQGPIFEDIFESGKKYTLEDVKYTEYSSKGFEVEAYVNLPSKKVYITYTCQTNARGKFDIEHLDLLIGYKCGAREEGKISQLDVSGEKENSELFANYIDIWFYSFDPLFGNLLIKKSKSFGNPFSNEVRKDIERNAPYVTEEIREYFDFGTKQLNIFNKLLDIEEKKRNSKGKNIYHILKEFDISGLSAKNPDLDRRGSTYNFFKFSIGSIDIDMHSYDDCMFLYLDDIDRKTYTYKNSMNIADNDKDGLVDTVNLNKTGFGRKDDGYEYIKELYTEEQVENIFRDAQQKLDLVNKALEDSKGK